MHLHGQWKQSTINNQQYVNSSYQPMTNEVAVSSLYDFKNKSHIKSIINNVSYEIGIKYFQELLLRFPDFYDNNKTFLIDLCELNDSIGNPPKIVFKDFTSCEPTDIRYIFHSALILEQMKTKNINNVNILEIGGGYGGLSFFLRKIAHLFDININSYTIYDLKEMSVLQQKYLEKMEFQTHTYQMDNYHFDYKDYFLISNYAFSEISLTYQKFYREIIFPLVSSGFILWNHMPLYNFIDKPLLIEKASRVPDNRLFNHANGLTPLTNFTLNSNNNWIEEVVVIF